MTKALHKEILRLKKSVLEMAQLARKMLEDSIQALLTQDVDLANEVDQRKHQLKDFDYGIEERTLRLLTLHQPMAKDMRRVATILKVITYLTRIGRYGKDIANVAMQLKDKANAKRIVNLIHMWEHVEVMIKKAIQGFDDSKIQYLEDFTERDDEVDQLRWSVFRECVTYMMEDPKCITPCSH